MNFPLYIPKEDVLCQLFNNNWCHISISLLIVDNKPTLNICFLTRQKKKKKILFQYLGICKLPCQFLSNKPMSIVLKFTLVFHKKIDVYL